MSKMHIFWKGKSQKILKTAGYNVEHAPPRLDAWCSLEI
jgi:hypothetical protein